MDRAEGRVPQAHELGGIGSGPSLEGDALAARIAELTAKAQGAAGKK
jgi:hypothetical protein